MTELKEKVNALNQLIISGDTIKGMETFYSDDIEMQENENVPRKGKSICICIDTERDNLKKVKRVESILVNQALDEEKNVVFSEWHFWVTYKDNNKFHLAEVSIQHWLDGKITKEKFYYNNFRPT